MGGDEGILTSLQEGAKLGATFGFIVGASRAFLNQDALAEEAMKKIADAKAANPSISRRALRTIAPTGLSGILKTTAIYAGVTSTFFVTKNVLRSQRGKDDLWNEAFAGAAAGALAGLKKGTVRASAGCGSALFATAVFYNLVGNTLGPQPNDPVSVGRKALYE